VPAFSFRLDSPEPIGWLPLINGRYANHTVCGLLMHPGLVLTTRGVPLGAAAVESWGRKGSRGPTLSRSR